MWWEYIIVAIAILLSLIYVIRYIKLKLTAPTRKCSDCPLMKNQSNISSSDNFECCKDCGI